MRDSEQVSRLEIQVREDNCWGAAKQSEFKRMKLVHEVPEIKM